MRSKMQAYLLTYTDSPDNEFTFSEELIKNVRNKKQQVVWWRAKEKGIKLNDRVFILDLTDDVRGIVASGHIVKELYPSPENDNKNVVDVEFDWVIDKNKEKILRLDDLNAKILEFKKWNHRYSGKCFDQSILKQLELAWANVIDYKNDIVNLLRCQEDIDPFSHDGSYELVQEAVKLYAAQPNLDFVDFNDIDFIYNMARINNYNTQKKYLENSNLPDIQKEKFRNVFNAVWEKAENGQYENYNMNKIGMIGSGFHNFNRPKANGSKPDPNLPRKVIEILVNIIKLKTSDEIYNYIKTNQNQKIDGMGIASFSNMAHCLKPELFPIINTNEGYGNLFSLLDIDYQEPKTLGEYATESQKIKKYLNDNFSFKNLRVVDLLARELGDVKDNKSKKTSLNFVYLLDYIKKYGNQKYQKPDSENLTAEEKAKYLALKEKGQKAAKEMDNIASYLANEVDLQISNQTKWLNGHNNEIRDYLWIQFKAKQVSDSRNSLSFFVNKSVFENGQQKPAVIFSLEMINKGATKADYQKHHQFLDMPLNSRLCYLVGSDEERNLTICPEKDPEQLKAKLETGEYKKIQIGKVIYQDENKSNDDYLQESRQALADLKPYYEYVIGGGKENKMEVKKFDLNTILYGAPGTGKTYAMKAIAVAICENLAIDEDYVITSLTREAVEKEFDRLSNDKRIAFTTFHQSYDYEEFIGGLKPEINPETKQLSYQAVSGIFKKFCDEANKRENADKKYVFIIDEINRGDISRIFGELITLLEDDKRISPGSTELIADQLKLKIPYFAEEFGVPSNVYILGTMNTADRSIALMDTALRRRFSFIEMPAKKDLLADIKIDDLDISQMLEAMNKRIEILYDREHVIGHAYFMKLKDNPAMANLSKIFRNKIIPLLQEYFYDDYEKIQLVLGDNDDEVSEQNKFIIKEPVTNVFKGNVDDLKIPEYRFVINYAAFNNLESYKKIYK